MLGMILIARPEVLDYIDAGYVWQTNHLEHVARNMRSFRYREVFGACYENINRITQGRSEHATKRCMLRWLHDMSLSIKCWDCFNHDSRIPCDSVSYMTHHPNVLLTETPAALNFDRECQAV